MPGMSDDTAELLAEIRTDEAWQAFFETLDSDGVSPATLVERVPVDRGRLKQFVKRATEEGFIERVGDEIRLTETGEEAVEYATGDWNPSSLDTKRGQTFEILSDGEWHCSSCELPSSQPAKDIQMLRKEGFEFVQNTGQGQGDYLHCENCADTTFHRKLKYPFPTQQSITRQEMPDSFKRRVRDLYDHEDAFDGSSPSTTLEVDHRVPEVRWDESESWEFDSMTDDDIREHFQILTRRNNLLKSRKCEQCVETGERPAFFGVEFYYEGDETYDESVGCAGCGWYNPQEWRAQLNRRLNLLAE